MCFPTLLLGRLLLHQQLPTYILKLFQVESSTRSIQGLCLILFLSQFGYTESGVWFLQLRCFFINVERAWNSFHYWNKSFITGRSITPINCGPRMALSLNIYGTTILSQLEGAHCTGPNGRKQGSLQWTTYGTQPSPGFFWMRKSGTILESAVLSYVSFRLDLLCRLHGRGFYDMSPGTSQNIN